VKDVLARYRAMQRWVAPERRRLKRTGGRKSQKYMRRARMLIEVDAVTLRELIGEMKGFSNHGGPR